MTKEQIGSGSKKVRGRSQRSIELTEAMVGICEKAAPITGRGVGYKLFTAGLIPSMGIIKNADGTKTDPMKKVYRLLKEAREEGRIAWDCIVDETRSLERVASWSDPDEYVRCVMKSYRRDFWDQQPVRVEVWSEKGTVRGVLQPVLDEYGVGFRVMHGFSGATPLYDVAQDGADGRELIALYVGDYDPSGLYMSEKDLPERIKRYGGDHVIIRRIAITLEQATGLSSFSAASKKQDPRHSWFVSKYGEECWELDAMDPNDLRDIVEEEIELWIEPKARKRCETVQAAEQKSLKDVLTAWKGARL